jgi:hypothetical protein
MIDRLADSVFLSSATTLILMLGTDSMAKGREPSEIAAQVGQVLEIISKYDYLKVCFYHRSSFFPVQALLYMSVQVIVVAPLYLDAYVSKYPLLIDECNKYTSKYPSFVFTTSLVGIHYLPQLYHLGGKRDSEIIAGGRLTGAGVNKVLTFLRDSVGLSIDFKEQTVRNTESVDAISMLSTRGGRDFGGRGDHRGGRGVDRVQGDSRGGFRGHRGFRGDRAGRPAPRYHPYGRGSR